LTVAFFGLGANAEIYAASMNHVGALACGILALSLAGTASSGTRRQIGTCLALLVGLMFGLTGLAMMVMAAVFIGLQHGVARAARIIAPPAVVFAAGWRVYRR